MNQDNKTQLTSFEPGYLNCACELLCQASCGSSALPSLLYATVAIRQDFPGHVRNFNVHIFVREKYQDVLICQRFLNNAQ